MFVLMLKSLKAKADKGSKYCPLVMVALYLMKIEIKISEADQTVGRNSIKHVVLKAIRRLTKTHCLSAAVVSEQMYRAVNQDVAALGLLQAQSDRSLFDKFYPWKRYQDSLVD